MSALSDYMEPLLITHLLTFAPFYIALFTTDPTDAGTGTEVVAASYGRQLMAFTQTTSSMANTSEVAFPEATESWGTITHIGIYDASTGGNLILHNIMDASKAIATGETMTFPVGTAVFTLN